LDDGCDDDATDSGYKDTSKMRIRELLPPLNGR